MITGASRADVAVVADLLADAFVGYPWTDWIVAADDRGMRLRQLHHLSLATVALPYGSVWLASCPAMIGGPVGAVAVLRPDRPVPHGVWSMFAQAQAAVLGDRHEAARDAEAAVADMRPQGPAVVVAALAVALDHRRRGLARRLLLPALRLADDLDVQAYLETSTPGNVALYSSSGFEITAHRTVPDGGPDVWGMRRPSLSERARS